MKAALVAWIVVLAAATAHAETRRVAVVVGNNAGIEQPPLHYAETDAGKMARVLAELGGVDTRDLFLLQGKSAATLRQTLSVAKQRVAELQRDAANRVILIFYFSGHSDGEALELGRDRVTFSELRRWLTTTGAEVRVALVDSCKSGGLLRAKGGRPGPAFQIRLTDELSSTGEALLTSSAADELALESREIGGSFFTHHLVSGLRGAADASGDGTVTLTEAYQYAYAHTIRTTGATVIGPQHPVYDYRLSGQGELILTELARPTALLELPKGFDRVLVIELLRDQVIAELTTDAQPRVAVQPGRFAVRAWRGGRVYTGRIAVSAGQTRAVQWAELVETAPTQVRTKGTAAVTIGAATVELRTPGPIATFAFGGQRGVAGDVDIGASARLGLRARGAHGPALGLVGASGRGDGFREMSAFVFGGYRLGVDRARLRAWVGLDLGLGVVTQDLDAGMSSSSGAAALAPSLGASLRISGPLSLSVEGAVPAALLRKDGELSVVALPAAWLGVVVDL